MSLSLGLLECDRCMATFPESGLLVSAAVYCLPDGGEIHVQKTLGWCYSCQSTAAIENLDPAELNSKLQDLQDRRQKAQLTLKNRLRQLVGKPLDEADTSRPDEEIIERGIALLASRLDGPRCLKCGSHEVTALPNYTADLTGRPVDTGFQHPKCYGYLWVSYDPDIRVMLRPQRVTYDPSGEKITIGIGARP